MKRDIREVQTILYRMTLPNLKIYLINFEHFKFCIFVLFEAQTK